MAVPIIPNMVRSDTPDVWAAGGEAANRTIASFVARCIDASYCLNSLFGKMNPLVRDPVACCPHPAVWPFTRVSRREAVRRGAGLGIATTICSTDQARPVRIGRWSTSGPQIPNPRSWSAPTDLFMASGNFVDRPCFRILVLSCDASSAGVHGRLSRLAAIVTQVGYSVVREHVACNSRARPSDP
jgi:hypothetical protein